MTTSNLTYMVIEDDINIYKSIHDRMRHFKPWKLVGFSSGFQDAVEKINTHRPDLLFMDWDIKGGNAYMLLDHIQAIPVYQPYVIFFTGFQSDFPEIAENIMNKYKTSVHKYILKPIWSKLTEQLPDILEEAKAHKKGTPAPKNHHWIESMDRRQFKIVPENLLYIEQSDTGKFSKQFVFVDNTAIEVKIKWKDCEKLLQRLCVNYFVANTRKLIINLTHVQTVSKPQVILKNNIKKTVARYKWKDFEDIHLPGV